MAKLGNLQFSEGDMDKKLKKLISGYQASVRTAVEIMQRSGIPLPITCHDWTETDIPAQGELEGGISYFKHGFGCEVSLPAGPVDFDFGRIGEIDGFDLWRLVKFASPNLIAYGFESNDAVEKSFEAAVKSGSLVSSPYFLYYVADTVRSLAVEVRKDCPGDSLPHLDQDEVLTLYAHCFLAAEVMRRNYEKLSVRMKKNGCLSRKDRVEFRIYFTSWLGYLRTTSEGFQQLNMRLLLTHNRPQSFSELISKSAEIGRILKQHGDALRQVRNNVFHLREDIKPLMRFAVDDMDRLTWAQELHSALDEFFSSYRVLCEVHYVMHGRESESQIRRDNIRNKKSRAGTHSN